MTAHVSAVLQAPPGAGKTTIVPLELLDEPWMKGGRVVVLEPRRLAARAAARRMAQLLGEETGGLIGHRVRHDTRVGPRTRIEVVTEGVLARFIRADPSLDGIGLLVFDEFHERSIHADLGLALALQTQQILRPDLRILIMSATIDSKPVAGLLGDCPVITSEGRLFPVVTIHRPPGRDVTLEGAVATVTRQALAESAGDVLVFLPGAGEIRRVASALQGTLPSSVELHQLGSTLPPAQQDRAIAPAPSGRRKLVLATSIAESSLTIEGVRVVVDAGWSRVPRYSPRTGMSRLATVRVSRASADQRRGRAGRLCSGVCYRLWPAHEDNMLQPGARPEILETDLAPLALDLAAGGITDPADLAWLDPPPVAAYAEARALLAQLGAIDGAGRVTRHGGAMAELGLHPRLAHMVLRARAMGAGRLGCALAALLSERDILRRSEQPAEADLTIRLEVVRGGGTLAAVDREALHRVRTEARRCGEQFRDRQPSGNKEPAGLLLAFAYPDRIGQRRPGEAGRYLLRSGLGASLIDDPLGRQPYIVAADLEIRGREARILRGAALSLEELETYFGEHMIEEDRIFWDATSQAIVATRGRKLGAIVIRDQVLRDPDAQRVRAVLLGGLLREGIEGLPWTDRARGVRDRLRFLHALEPHEWPDVSDAALAASIETWLAPALTGMRRRDDVQRLDLGALLLAAVLPARRGLFEELAPSHLSVPSGSRLPLDYGDPTRPMLAVRLQEMFGQRTTPRVGGGRVTVLLHLLSPAGRPLQVTQDLETFWAGSYAEVRREMRGRYPRHAWPKDPLAAEPVQRARRMGERRVDVKKPGSPW